MNILRNIFFNFIIILICLIILSLWGFYSAIRPFKITSSITPEYFGLAYKNIEFYTTDHVLIRGWFIPNSNADAKTIIMLHGYPADKGDILPSRYFLHKKYNLLFIDFRHLGKSAGNYTTIGKKEVLDVKAAIQWLKQNGNDEVGIWGFSVGGAVGLMSAAVAPEIKAVIAESSYARLDKMAYEYFRIPILKYPLGALLRFWGWLFLGYDLKTVSPVDSALKLNIPILITHSKNDNVISFEHAELFESKLKNKPNVNFLFFDNQPHGQSYHNYESIIETFFDKNL